MLDIFLIQPGHCFLQFEPLPSVSKFPEDCVITTFLVVLPRGSHQIPSRTRKLSLAGPMILRW